MKDYARSDLQDLGGKVRYPAEFGRVIGWVSGYMTAANHYLPNKINNFAHILDEIAWVASWCRDNSSKTIVDAMEALTKLRTGVR